MSHTYVQHVVSAYAPLPEALLSGETGIPVLRFDTVQVQLHPELMTAEAQVAWLRRFASRIQLLADKVEQRAAESVSA